MRIRTGCDLVPVDRITGLSPAARRKIFLPSEMDRSDESLAGIFAAKEACKKIFNHLDWHDIRISHEDDGRPLADMPDGLQVVQQDISISHDGGLAMAIVIMMLEESV